MCDRLIMQVYRAKTNLSGFDPSRLESIKIFKECGVLVGRDTELSAIDRSFRSLINETKAKDRWVVRDCWFVANVVFSLLLFFDSAC